MLQSRPDPHFINWGAYTELKRGTFGELVIVCLANKFMERDINSHPTFFLLLPMYFFVCSLRLLKQEKLLMQFCM